MTTPRMHPDPPGLDLVDDGPFLIRVLDHEAGPANGAGIVYEGPSTFTARPAPYRKQWGHRYIVTVDAVPFLHDIVARVGPGGGVHVDYVAGGNCIEAGERYWIELVDRMPTKDPVPTASELHRHILDALAPFGVTEIRFE